MSNAAFIDSESDVAAGTAVGDLSHVIHAVRDEAATQPAPDDDAAEGQEVLEETGVGLDGRGHLLATARADQRHGIRAKVHSLAENIIMIIIPSFIKTVASLPCRQESPRAR